MNVISQRYCVHYLKTFKNMYGMYQKYILQNLNKRSFLYTSQSRTVNRLVLSHVCFPKILLLKLFPLRLCSHASSNCVTPSSEIDKPDAESNKPSQIKVLIDENVIFTLYQELWSDEETKNNVLQTITEYETWKALGCNAPSTLNVHHVRELLNLETKNKRKKYLAFLLKKERIKLHDVIKKEKKREQKIANMEIKRPNDHIMYGLGKNSFLLSIRKRSLNRFYHQRTANASLFGQKIVIDIDYDEFMSNQEIQSCSEQLSILWKDNKLSRDPFDLYFCNVKPCSKSMKLLQIQMHNIDPLISCSESSYLDIFPKENLVYLSPHAKETLQVYNHDAVYIIGAFVDSSRQYCLSQAKAEKEGLKMYALPLDEHIMWGSGTKNLSVNQVFEIMMELKMSGDWKKALRFVPQRKIRRLNQSLLEKNNVQTDRIFLIDTSKQDNVSS